MVIVGVVCWLALAAGVELTFELPDNAKECFFEEIEKGTSSSLEFQVGPEGQCISYVMLINLRCKYSFITIFSRCGCPDVLSAGVWLILLHLANYAA